MKIFHLHHLPLLSPGGAGLIPMEIFPAVIAGGDLRRIGASLFTQLSSSFPEGNPRVSVFPNFSQCANWTGWKWLQGGTLAMQGNKAANYVEPETSGVGASRQLSCFNVHTGV